MINSQLIELLQCFSPAEYREFQLFLASPYFNRGTFVRETQGLLEFILKASPDFLPERLERTAAYRAIFPGAPMVEGKIDKVMSELHKLAKEFISVQQHGKKENEFMQLLDLATFYSIKGLNKRHQGLIQKLIDRQQQIAQYDLEFFHRQFLLDFEIHNYESMYNQKRDDLSISKTLQSLDLFYHSRKIELLNRFLLQKKFARLEIPESIVKTIEENQFPDRYAETYPVLQIAHKIFRLLENSNTQIAEFEELHHLLNTKENAIEPGLLRHYFTYIRNICALLFNSGRTELLPTLFKLQKEHLERGYLYFHDKISPSTFLNVSNTAFKLKEYEWVRNFIESHEGRVVGDNATQDYYRLVQSIYLFVMGQYEAALEMIPQAFHELDYHLFARRLELKIYYELESDLLPYKIDAFKMYLSRASHKVIPATTRDRNVHFVNLLFQMSLLPRRNTNKVQRLLDRIQAKETMADRDWLLEKAMQLS